ncbi:MAG: hypothetical protein IH589_19140 [Anaerolineales bacterium]|nr:hypothetical protein [Anaerolineales bacterium]
MYTKMAPQLCLMIPMLNVFTASNQTRDWSWAMEFITPIILVSLGIILYILHRKHQNKKKEL